MPRQQELELLAEWLGIEHEGYWESQEALLVPYYGTGDRGWWGPLISDTDFLNMVAGRVDMLWGLDQACAMWMNAADSEYSECTAYFKDHNNDKVAAMKHAAYQVCLMAAREWKSGQ